MGWVGFKRVRLLGPDVQPSDLRADMPALDDVVYLNTGASGPSPRRVVDAACEFLRRHEYEAPAGEGMYPVAWDMLDETRRAVADLLGASVGDIALTQSTADGVTRVASALDWDAGDVVVRTDLEHPAGILPWDRLADVAGVEVRVHETERGRLDLDALAEQTADADLLCLSSLSWNYGTRLRVADAVEIAHENGARVLVDAVQSPGQMPVDVSEWGADFVAAAGHKWLLGPWGAGFLYVRPSAVSDLDPRHIGYRSVQGADDAAYRYRDDARRLEIGTVSPVPYAGLREAVDVIRSVGLDRVQSRVAALTDRLKAGLDPDQLLSPAEYESGLVTFRPPGSDPDPETTVERLADSGVRIRSLPAPEAVRASVHVFNAEADVDALLDNL
jgi:selenocysteine lyase/cysteine desulfurase